MLGVEQSQFRVGLRGGFLHGRQRFDEYGEFPQRNAGDWKILQCTQGLHAVQRFIRHLTLTKEIVLRAGAMSAKAERPAAAYQGGIGATEAHGDGAGGPGHQRGVELRRFTGDVIELRAGQCHGGAGHDHAGRRSVRGVIEQQPLPHRFARTEGHEARGAAI